MNNWMSKLMPKAAAPFRGPSMVVVAIGVGVLSCFVLLFQNCGGSAASVGGGNTASGGSGPMSPNGDPTGVLAQSANVFLTSTGVNTHISQGYNANNYIAPLKYLGIRNLRDSIGNVSTNISVHQQTGVLFDLNAGADLTDLIAAGKTMAAAGALLSFEGPNEPNNFPVTYNGVLGGGFSATSTWLPVAQFQRDLYSAVKADSVLNGYPVFGPSEVGAEVNNVGLQFNVIPTGAGALLPDGTQFSDYVNPHNYVSSTQNIYVDNQAWNCADPTLSGAWDGLFGDSGITWNKHFQGYTLAQLPTVARVTTETGYDSVSNIGGERVQGVVLVNNYLAQFKRGWRYTFIYELIDGEGSTGNQGLYHSDYTPKLVANYIHNLTTILADTTNVSAPQMLNYTIANEPATVHDLLIQKSAGSFELIVWDERASASDSVTVNLGRSRSTVNVYDVTSGSTPTQTLANVSTVSLSLSDHAMVIELP